jgi:hypothetical protein
MENIFIKAEEIPQNLINDYFRDKDMVSLDDLIATLDNVDWELKTLQDEYENFKQNVEDNYKFMPTEEQIDYSNEW